MAGSAISGYTPLVPHVWRGSEDYSRNQRVAAPVNHRCSTRSGLHDLRPKCSISMADSERLGPRVFGATADVPLDPAELRGSQPGQDWVRTG